MVEREPSNENSTAMEPEILNKILNQSVDEQRKDYNQFDVNRLYNKRVEILKPVSGFNILVCEECEKRNCYGILEYSEEFRGGCKLQIELCRKCKFRNR